jgi:hypothetical protein
MDGVIMIFSQEEIMLMIGVVSVLLISITILTILDLREYLKNKKGLIIEEDTEPVLEEVEPVTVTLKEDKEDEIYLEELPDETVEIKPEVNPIVEESEEVYIPQVEAKEVVKPEKKKLDAFEELEEIESKLPNKKDDVTNFEAEQERTAIISLDELMKKSNELYSDNEEVQYDDGNAPISIDEVIKMFKKDDEPTVVETKEVPEVFKEVMEEKVPYSKKETIPFISSVYGIEKENNALEFENTATYEKLDRQKYNDFVAQLKEMNENK